MIFDELLKKDVSKEAETLGSNTGIKTVQFYRTDVTRTLIEETFTFIGETLPAAEKYVFKEVPSSIETLKAQVAFIDLIDADNILNECRQLSERLPASLSVIILGSVDSISVVRELKAFGFYYLLWPVTKIELGEFIEGVLEQIESANFKNRRLAKRIGVVGTRGGIGATMIAAELGWLLSHEKRASCIVVDNNYLSSNLDIFLGVKNREKRRLNATEITGNMDDSAARSLLTRVSPRLDYLSLGLNNESSSDFHETNDVIVSVLKRDTNFIVDDLSASVSFDIKAKMLVKQLDLAVIVMEPTIACLRETSALLQSIKKHIEESEQRKTLRILLVLNKHRASRFQSVTEAEITKYLSTNIDVVLPYEISAEEVLVSGNKLSSGKTKLGSQLRSLCSLIVGEQTSSPRAKSLLSLFSKKGA